MTCPSCGTNLAEGTTFCPICGMTIVPTKTSGSREAVRKGITLLPLILTIVCCLALVVSYFVVMNTSIEDLSVIATLSAISGEDLDEFDDMKDELKANYKQLDAQFDVYKDELSNKEEKKVEKCLDSFKALSKSLSINNMNQAISAAKDVAKIDAVEDMNLDDELDVLDEAAQILNIISVVILILMLICLAFCASGGFLRVRGLVITGLVFSLLYGLIFCGILFTILFLALDIGLFIVLGMDK